MCRLVARLGETETTLSSLVLEPEHSLLVQSYAPREMMSGVVNADGFGVGWYAPWSGEEPAVYRSNAPLWADRSFAGIAPKIRSAGVFAAVRSATPGLPAEESGVPPFVSGPFTFMHNGAIEGFRDGPMRRLRDSLSEESYAGLLGVADSETVFAVALDLLREGADLGEALEETVRRVSGVCGRLGRYAALNLALTDGRGMAFIRHSTAGPGNSLYLLEGGRTFPGAVVVASERLDGDTGWREVPDRHLLTVDGESGAALRPLSVRRQCPEDKTERENVTREGTVEVILLDEAGEDAGQMVRDVRAGLSASPKDLSPWPKYFYDAEGSRLFEEITAQPEYYQTGAELEILVDRSEEIVARTRCQELVELGSGSASKTRSLIDAMFAAGGSPPRYVPLDVSESALRESGERLVGEYPGLEVQGFIGDFDLSLGRLLGRPSDRNRLIAFLGGTIGNFTPEKRREFLDTLRAGLRKGDRVLIGLDLVKDPRTLEAAYNDAAGFTARFNRNMIRVINHRLGTGLDPELFSHRAVYDPERERVEMWLDAETAQKVHTPDLEASFQRGEGVRTEISAKFTRESAARTLEQAGLELLDLYTDNRGLFALALGGPAF